MKVRQQLSVCCFHFELASCSLTNTGVVRKGRTVRGQWFYATDTAAQNYVWFHSVYDLVRRSIDAKGVDVVDLGPSGSDAFSQLKERYGFISIDDWVSRNHALVWNH